MKWTFDPKTGGMAPQKKKGFRVSGRIGGVMVEDFDKNIQFLINYGTDRVTHCVGCSDKDLHIFDDWTARRIADEIGRVARSHNTSTKYSDYRLLSSSFRNVRESGVKRFSSYVCECMDKTEFPKAVAGRADANLEKHFGDPDYMSVAVSSEGAAPVVTVNGSETDVLGSLDDSNNITFFVLPENTKPNTMMGVNVSLDPRNETIDKFEFVRDRDILSAVRSVYNRVRGLDEFRSVTAMYIQVLY